MAKSLSFILVFMLCALLQHFPGTKSLSDQRQAPLLETSQSTPLESSTSPDSTPPPSTTPPLPFAPGRSIRIASTGVGSWREISLSRIGPAPNDASSGSYTAGRPQAALFTWLGCYLLSVWSA